MKNDIYKNAIDLFNILERICNKDLVSGSEIEDEVHSLMKAVKPSIEAPSSVIGNKQDGKTLFRVLAETNGCHWIDIWANNEEEAEEYIKEELSIDDLQPPSQSEFSIFEVTKLEG